MRSKRLTHALSVIVLAAGLEACGGQSVAPSEAPIAIAAVTENALMANSLMANSLMANSLMANALVANSLMANSLMANSLMANALAPGGLADPSAVQFMKYLVSCALDSKQSVDLTLGGQAYHFPGSVGLAPQWGKAGGSCDGSCQRWVSACLLARIDAAGVEREISVRGLHPALLPSRSEMATYTQREATYFGNVFVPGQPRFVCLPPGATSDERVCGDSLSNCPMTVLGSCATDCLFQGLFGEYDICSDSGKRLSGTSYLESATVFLPKSTM
ncbi:MAG TPA: hypothetical protein VHO67_03830 [Polyangia bacterium]|nr:hypothetical protein [Polyangia bacterium]